MWTARGLFDLKECVAARHSVASCDTSGYNNNMIL